MPFCLTATCWLKHRPEVCFVNILAVTTAFLDLRVPSIIEVNLLTITNIYCPLCARHYKPEVEPPPSNTWKNLVTYYAISKIPTFPPKHVHCVLKFYFCDLSPLGALHGPRSLLETEILTVKTNSCVYYNLPLWMDHRGQLLVQLHQFCSPWHNANPHLTDHLSFVYYQNFLSGTIWVFRYLQLLGRFPLTSASIQEVPHW